MKKFVVVLSLFLFMVAAIQAQQKDADKAAIKNAIQTAYVDGLQNEGDAEKIDFGFHPDFVMVGVGEDGKVWKYPIANWKESALKKKAEGKLPLKDDSKISVKFKSIDITGNAAVVKMDYFRGGQHEYVDYISLYKFEDGWKMVAKIFHKL